MPGSTAKHFLAALVWCALLGVAYVVMESQIKPKVAVAHGTDAEISIPRSRDGHFYVAGAINGQAVTFMVDTGASSVSVGRSVAQRIGLPPGSPINVSTANGSTQAEEVAGQAVAVGGLVIRDARIVVLDNISSSALLGQNVLRHLDVRQTAERMTLRPRAQ